MITNFIGDLKKIQAFLAVINIDLPLGSLIINSFSTSSPIRRETVAFDKLVKLGNFDCSIPSG
jgi:hypothetical protein